MRMVASIQQGGRQAARRVCCCMSVALGKGEASALFMKPSCSRTPRRQVCLYYPARLVRTLPWADAVWQRLLSQLVLGGSSNLPAACDGSTGHPPGMHASTGQPCPHKLLRQASTGCCLQVVSAGCRGWGGCAQVQQQDAGGEAWLQLICPLRWAACVPQQLVVH
jgi:hypothetical protein